MSSSRIIWTLGLSWTLLLVAPAWSGTTPAGTSFTYQGNLNQSGVPASGNFDFVFNLIDGPDPLSDIQVATQTLLTVPVVAGLFQVELDFGSVFSSGIAYWLEIEVRPAGIGGTTALFPLQKITAAPYALNADTLDGNDSSAFLTGETDPTVNSLAQAGLSCADGQVAKLSSGLWACGNDIDTALTEAQVDSFVSDNGFLTSETDPQVGSVSTSYVPVWSGSQLVNGRIFDNGNVGIATTSPTSTLHVNSSHDSAAQVGGFRTQRPGTSKYLYMGYDSGDYGYLQAIDVGVAWKPLLLNPHGGKVGIGTNDPKVELHVNGKIRVDVLQTGNNIDICVNSNNTLSNCSSSKRFKRDIADLNAGLEVTQKLRPVKFRWIEDNSEDFGFVAEEVEKIGPLLATYADGQVVGVRYRQLTAVLVNAIQEQQSQIEQLKVVFCMGHSESDLCD